MNTKTFNLIPQIGTDVVKLNMSRDELKMLYSQLYFREFKKGGKFFVDAYKLFHAYISESGTVDAFEFFEPCEVHYNGFQLIGSDYEECKRLFLKDDPDIVIEKYDEEVSFRSLNLQISVYGPYGKVESVMIAKKGYFKE